MVDRQHRPEVKQLITAKLTIELNSGQSFYSTPKSWEIWQNDPLRFVKRFPRKSILWVVERD